MGRHLAFFVALFVVRGNSSVVEHRLAKARVESSNLFSRSIQRFYIGAKGRELERQPGRISFPAPNNGFTQVPKVDSWSASLIDFFLRSKKHSFLPFVTFFLCFEHCIAHQLAIFSRGRLSSDLKKYTDAPISSRLTCFLVPPIC